MNFSNTPSSPSGVKLRCKDGDLAIMVGDVPGCEFNIGTLVSVRGPTTVISGYTCWHIKPVEKKRVLVRLNKWEIRDQYVFWKDKIYHPDCFLLPIRPPEEDDAIETEQDLKIERPNNATV